MKSTVIALSMLALFSSCGAQDPRRSREPVPPLEEIEDWIAAREAKVPGLKQGVEAGIVWGEPGVRRKTPLSIVYLPGYTATRGEIHPVAERVASALRANLFFARPTGQGAGPDGHRTVSADDWTADSLEAYEIGTKLGERVVIMATSTGATLAIGMILGAAKISPAATVLVSPNLTPLNRQSEMLLWPGSEWILGIMMGETMAVEPRNDLQALYWDTTHHSHSLIPMMKLVAYARKQDFSAWPTPVLVVYDPEDSVVDETVTVKLFAKAPADKTTLVEWEAAEGDDHHVLAGDALSPNGTEKMIETTVGFLRKVLER